MHLIKKKKNSMLLGKFENKNLVFINKKISLVLLNYEDLFVNIIVSAVHECVFGGGVSYRKRAEMCSFIFLMKSQSNLIFPLYLVFFHYKDVVTS